MTRTTIRRHETGQGHGFPGPGAVGTADELGRLSEAVPEDAAAPVRWSAARVATVGVGLVAIGYLAMTVFAAVTLPWRGTADAYEHLDYVYQLLHGHLPDPMGHAWSPVGEPSAAERTGRQFASAHPPLFYLLMAPLAAPFLDYDWHVAVALVRGADILIGLVGLVALGWFGWIIGGAWRVRLAIALPAVGTATFAYLRYAAEVYNDTLVTTLTILALALSARMLLRGLTRPSLLALAVVCILGLGTKATFVLTLGLVGIAVIAAALLHRTGSRRRALLGGVAWATALAVPPLLAWGWFYQRNYRLSGSWYVSTPKETPLSSRPYRSMLDNLTSPDFYLIIPRGLVGRATDEFVYFARAASTVVFAVAAALTLLVLLARLWRRSLPPLPIVLVVGVLAAHLAGSYALQLSHATGYGAYNWRYFLPSTPAIAMILAVGLAGLGWMSAVALPAFVAALFALNAVSFMEYGVQLDNLAADPWDVWGTARVLAAESGWPAALPGVCLVVAALAVLGLGVLIARQRAHFAARA